jgi:exopolysaccharide biosynthesis polyprenyl glycosylphosphotransferase
VDFVLLPEAKSPDSVRARAAGPSRPSLIRASWWRWRVGVFFATMDLIALVTAWLIVPTGGDGWTLLGLVIATLLTCAHFDLQRSRLELSVVEELPVYLLTAIACIVVVIGAAALRPGRAMLGTDLLFGGVFLSLLILSRAAAYGTARALRRSRFISHPVVIVGAGQIGRRLADALLAHPEYGLKPIGFVDATDDRQSVPLCLPMLGDTSALPSALRENGVNDVIFSFGTARDVHVARAVRACVRMDCQVFVVPRFFEVYGASRRLRMEVIWGVPLARLQRWPLRRSKTWLKRGSDVVLSVLALTVLAPVIALSALAVRLEGGKGVIFRQVRVGLNGNTFTLLKFRSMRPADELEQDTQWSIDGDNRIGRVGRLLRRTSLDELPQLINVLRGDMSLVGPRPERLYFAHSFGGSIVRYADRQRVAAGLTGWAQVNGLRGNTSIEDRVNFDNYYIDNWSLWNDVKILIRTLPTLFRRAFASPAGVSVDNTELDPAAQARSRTR